MQLEASLWPCGGGGGGGGWCLGRAEQMGCGLVSPAGVSQAWRERGGAAGPQLLVLKTLGKDSLCLSKERMTSSSFRRPWILKLEPKRGGGECLHCFPMWAPPWGVALCQEVPWAWADAGPTLIRASCGVVMGTRSVGTSSF